jgi:glycine/D-amino acid oxidase-like deaminating enzyme
MRHAPLWLDSLPTARRPSYPRLRGDQTARVAIVGAGLTGAACAISFAAAGIEAVVLEAESVGAGMTAGDAGLLREGFAGSFHAAVAAHGLRTSRAAWDTMRRGALDFAAALRRYEIKCQLEAEEHVSFAAPGPDAGRVLRREYQARHDAGLDGSWMTPQAVTRETAVESAGGIRAHAAVIDPYRACIGLLAAATERGARVHERSLVRRIRPARAGVEVQTAGGMVRAETVIVATAAPIQDLRALRRHLRAEHAYGVVTGPMPPAVRRQVGRREAVLEDAAEPGRIIRWVAGDRVLVHGARQAEVPAQSRDRALTQRTGQLMYELSLRYPAISGLPPAQSWYTLDHETADGLPLLGPHRNFPGHLFAFGSSRHGVGLAWVAARLALRHFQGEATRADEALGFHRIL